MLLHFTVFSLHGCHPVVFATEQTTLIHYFVLQAKQISDNELYLLIKCIKSFLRSVAKPLSYIEDARCLKVKVMKGNPNINCCSSDSNGIVPLIFIFKHLHNFKQSFSVRTYRKALHLLCRYALIQGDAK